MVELQLIGGGKMGEALLGGILASQWCVPEGVRVVELDASRRAALTDRYGVLVDDQPGAAAGTILAVKPGDIAAVAAAVTVAGGGRLLSIAAGVSVDAIEDATGHQVAVVRAMPNTPALVGVGAAAICAGSTASEADLEWAATLLGSVGTVIRVPESAIDAVTGVSGSGPAYVFLVAEALADAGVLVGLPRDQAVALANQTLLGAATMLVETGSSAAELRAGVTSPGGTTAAALQVLEQRGLRAAFVDAVVAARDRSREMGS